MDRSFDGGGKVDIGADGECMPCRLAIAARRRREVQALARREVLVTQEQPGAAARPDRLRDLFHGTARLVAIGNNQEPPRQPPRAAARRCGGGDPVMSRPARVAGSTARRRPRRGMRPAR